MKRIYFDYAASTPVDPQVEAAMKPYFGKIFGNPHSLHQFGQESSRAVFSARRRIAESIGADYKQIVFTGSATEANNLAIRGIAKSIKYQVLSIKYPRIITTTVEHESVLETCRDLERDGVEVVYIPVDCEGIVDLKKLKAALNERTVLVSIMHANNEIGTVQPIEEISEILRNFRVRNDRNVGDVGDEQFKQSASWLRSNKRSGPTSNIQHPTSYPLFHTDAVQSFQYLDCSPAKLGVDLITLSAHKIYGPKGIGALYIRPIGLISPIVTGSGQEQGLRSGTDNVPYIVGFGEAVEITMKMREKESKRIKELRDYFWKNLKRKLPRLLVNGSTKERLPNNINIYFPGFQAQDLLIKLDLAGIATSPGAACSTRVSKISYVLEALGFSEERAGGSLRFSLGRQTTKGDIDYAIDKIRRIVL